MTKVDKSPDRSLTNWRIDALYRDVRATTAMLASPLSDADATAQSMPDASPAKWHLAHTTWFFEAMVLQTRIEGYRPYERSYSYLFNSYYETVGDRHPRPMRGLLTRPSLEEILAYRRHVDEAIAQLLTKDLTAETQQLIEIGCHHEQQHQELLLTDILHLFAQNPIRPAYRMGLRDMTNSSAKATPLKFLEVAGGIDRIGHAEPTFAFDTEGPQHSVIFDSFQIGSRPIVNAEWIEFMEDGGYENPLLWLSDGWAAVRREGWTAPLYWERDQDNHLQMTLSGLRPVTMSAPVAHISYYEADAFARWAGARLPTEVEWEVVAQSRSMEGNFADTGDLAPQRAQLSVDGITQLFGDVWEWTSSPFTPYPRFKAAPGAIGEYNGKFTSGQYVLRGGSCVTPPGHIRATYRNFFPPTARWQFSGLRLAKDE